MKKNVVPVLIAIVLIIIVGAAYVVPKVLEKYSYSKERADLNTYFDVTGDQAAIYLADMKLEEKAIVRDGGVYFPYSIVENYLTRRFYYNEEEQVLKFTTPTNVHTVYLTGNPASVEISSPDYNDTGVTYEDYPYPILVEEAGLVYLAADYLDEYSGFSYTLYEDPYRIQLFVADDSVTTATLTKDMAVRIKAGIKCDVLEDLKKGDTVVVMPQQQLEEWTLVKTEDCCIGYIETEYLENQKETVRSFAYNFTTFDYPTLSRDHKICLGWHQIMSEGGNSTLDEYVAGKDCINVVSPTWLFVTGDEGDLNNISSQDYVKKAHDKGMEVWVLSDDFTNENTLNNILSHTDLRIRLENNLVDAVLACGADGINIDYEHILQDNGDNFAQFLRELSILTHKNGIVLSVDNYPPQGGSYQYRRDEQGIVVDYVVVMGYDEHWAGGGVAGSVASLPYVERGISDTIAAGVPAQKIINGVPFYTRIWQTEGSDVSCTTVDMAVSAEWVNNHKVTLEWDEDACQNYGRLESGTAVFEVWMEDTQSLQVKLNIMDKYDISGVACWKLGLETSDVWPLISAYLSL